MNSFDLLKFRIISGIIRGHESGFVHGNGLRNKPGFEVIAELNTNLYNDERSAEWKGQTFSPMKGTWPGSAN